jgi:hypothetical protein
MQDWSAASVVSSSVPGSLAQLALSRLRRCLLLLGPRGDRRWPVLEDLSGDLPASHLEFVIPLAPRCGGCSYLREWNQSPVCKEIYRVFAGAKCNCFKYSFVVGRENRRGFCRRLSLCSIVTPEYMCLFFVAVEA